MKDYCLLAGMTEDATPAGRDKRRIKE